MRECLGREVRHVQKIRIHIDEHIFPVELRVGEVVYRQRILNAEVERIVEAQIVIYHLPEGDNAERDEGDSRIFEECAGLLLLFESVERFFESAREEEQRGDAIDRERRAAEHGIAEEERGKAEADI